MVSADAVYKLDYGALVEEHVEAGAAVTMVTTEVDPDDAGRYGVVQTAGGDVRDYVYKPDEPRGNLVSNEVFVFSPGPGARRARRARERRGRGLEDLGHELLPRLVDAGQVARAPLRRLLARRRDDPGLLGVPQELLGDEPPIDLDDPAWPILTRAIARRASAHAARGRGDRVAA